MNGTAAVRAVIMCVPRGQQGSKRERGAAAVGPGPASLHAVDEAPLAPVLKVAGGLQEHEPLAHQVLVESDPAK